MTTPSIKLRPQAFAPWLDQLESAAALPADWDSYGASTISSTAVTTARALLNELSVHSLAPGLVPFHLAPIPTGGIQLEWKRDDGGGLELWIDAAGTIDAVLDRPGAEPRIVEKHLANRANAIAEIEA